MNATKKTEETKLKIATAAYKLIKTQGFEATSIKQICKEAKVAYSTFYFYFPEKISVISAIFSQIALFKPGDFSTLLSTEGAWNKLWKAHCIYFDEYCEYGPEIYAQFLISLLNNPKIWANMQQTEHLAIMVPLIKQAQKKGEILIRDDPMIVFRSSLHLTHDILFHWAAKKKDFYLHEEMRKHLEVFYQVRDDLRTLSKT
ncbi:MAG: TetR/AcrR family transcriptional regulator [Defluviitaleaceae bacterium]|nr:TetR/AcrR family transcriptional regulator [Defluviitaleaceae bacterium]